MMRLGLFSALENLVKTETSGALPVPIRLLHPKMRPAQPSQPLTGNRKTLPTSWVPLDALSPGQTSSGSLKAPSPPLPKVCYAGLISPYSPGRCKKIGEDTQLAGSQYRGPGQPGSFSLHLHHSPSCSGGSRVRHFMSFLRSPGPRTRKPKWPC